MATAAYPSGLPTMQATRSRSQPASFRMSEPRRGYGYAQANGTDTPVFWNATFRFSRSDAVRFQLWFKTVINSGRDEFTIPIRTEFGTVTHVARFLPDSLLDTSHDGGDVVTYTATIMARAQVIPAAYTDAAEMILALPDWLTWADMLDLSIATLPEA